MTSQLSNQSSEYPDIKDDSDTILSSGVSQVMPDAYSVDDEQINDRNGNYIFTVGNVGCGKSTIQSMMIARLWGRKDIIFDYQNQDNDHRHDKVLNDMVTKMQRGILPERTKQGRMQEFSISMGQKGKVSLDLNFLEISGEDIRSIVPTLSKTDLPSLNKQLVTYLKLPTQQINKRFLFVSDAEENRKRKTSYPELSEDVLFNELLRYLLGKNSLGIPKINVFFVISKWDIVQDEYKNIEEYLSMNFPQTMGILQSDRCKVNFMPFSVGEIRDNIDENGELIDTRVKSLNSKYIDYLLHIIYHSFTQNNLRNFPKIEKKLWDRVKRIFH